MKRGRFYALFLCAFLSLPIVQLKGTDEEAFVPFAVGHFDEELGEVADRDRNMPSFYDRNKEELMRQRDRWLLSHGQCYPPPGVLVSPSITLPPRRNGEFYIYDPRNSRYRSAR